MSEPINEDFTDIVACLLEAGVDFLVVGAYALSAHGVVRATEAIDILVRPTPENAGRVVQALTAFGAPLESHGVSAGDFEQPGTVYQLGLPPRRIDLLTSISGVSFDEAAEECLRAKLGEHELPFIGRRALIKNKLATGRGKDAADVQALQAQESSGVDRREVPPTSTTSTTCRRHHRRSATL